MMTRVLVLAVSGCLMIVASLAYAESTAVPQDDRSTPLVADSVTICNGRLCMIRGHIEFMPSVGGGMPSRPGGNTKIVIWRSLASNEQTATRHGLQTGKAYLLQDGPRFEYVRDVDLQLSDDELAKLFGVVVKK
jgi:hypothetical protein